MLESAAPPFEFIEEVVSDERFRLYRASTGPGRPSVLIKSPLAHPAGADDIARLKREFEILHASPIDAVTRALDLVCDELHTMLVLEDRGDRPLASVIATRSIPVGWVIDYALQIVAALAALHRAGILHRGLSPRSVLLNEHSGRIRLSDFSEAARNAGEAAVALSPQRYRTRLPYVAPEQTGRINRTCDERSDYYSLGVLLYELLLGHPPFRADDPLELMHAHIARLPPAPAAVAAAVPVPLSQIVMKLLAKQLEERYQSVHCLQQDLERCRREWTERGRIAPFEIAARDVSERFAIPQKLYGRSAAQARLLAAFERSLHERPSLLLVEGAAGVGKTALVSVLHEPLARARGNFVSGKFDQLSRDVPYGALAQALRQCVQRLLTMEPARLARQAERIRARLGANAALIAALIPELEWVLGPQQPVPALPPTEAQNRFTLAFQNFLAALTAPEAPLAIFLDDLQWVDSSTLRLLPELLTHADMGPLLLIGAYRASDVGPDHPLPAALAAVEAANVPIDRLALTPLGVDELTQLASDALRLTPGAAEPLARLLWKQTGGNPFFATQSLFALQREGLITFDAERLQWRFRLEDVAGVAAAADVGDLMERKIERLPASARETLTRAAAIGNRFDAHTLAVVCDRPLRATLADLDAAVDGGLIVAEAGHVFTFLHDRVQQAAYARIDPADRPHMHASIGRLLQADEARTDAETLDRIFDIASHLNVGASLIETPQERVALAQLNLAAGEKAKASAAFRTALGYFGAGRDLLGADHWRSDYRLKFTLEMEAAQCEYLCGDFDAAAAAYRALLAHAESAFDRAQVHRLRAIHFENTAHYEAALACARDALRCLGLALPDSAQDKERALAEQIDHIGRCLATQRIASFADLPAMSDAAMQLGMKILTDAWSEAYILGDTTLARLISALLVRLSLTHGNTPESAYGYVTYAITAGPVLEDYPQAWEWGNLALRVNERFDDRRLRAKIYQQFHAHVNLWCRPYAHCIAYAREAWRSGLESGDFLYAAYGAATEAWPAFAASQDLAQFIEALQPNLDLLVRLKNVAFADALRLMLGWARALRATTSAPPDLSHAGFDEAAYVERYRGNAFFSMFHAIARLQLSFLLDDTEGAARAAEAVRATAGHLIGMQWSVQYRFWNGLRLAAMLPALDEDDRTAAIDEIRASHRSIAVLATSCAENFGCWALLLEAELARAAGNALRAIELHEQAVQTADRFALLQQQALANERLARFWLDRGNRTVASVYLRTAAVQYAKWGAQAKVNSLQQGFGELLKGFDPTEADAGAAGGALDMATIRKAALAIASNVELAALIRQMLAIAIESAGATDGALIDIRDDEPYLAAVADTRAGTSVELRDQPLRSEPAGCSPAVVNYVLRTGASLLIADAGRDEQFARDPYLSATGARSVLCLPILHQGRTCAVLYLEHRLAADAFRPERVEVMRLLAAQAAVSLESARLLDGIKREMTERQRAERRLRAIETGTASVTGGDFFRALVRYLAQALQVRYVFVAECLREDPVDGKIVRTRAFWNGEGFGQDFEFAVPGTPCAQVVAGEVCHFENDLQSRFPADTGLVRWNACSYLGLPLVGSGNDVIGHMAILDSQPMPDATLALTVMRVSAGRAGAELERIKADEGQQRALAEVEKLKNRLEAENVYLRRELIANVSHDLRSPLASLRGYLDTLLLKEETLNAAERRSYLRIAVRQAEQLQDLISELFDLARLDFDGYRINAEPLNLGELARDVLQKFELSARAQRVQLQLDIDDAMGLVQADIGLIERTLENLLENSLAHTPAGGRVCLAVLAHGDGALIQVSDTGSGIPESDLPHVFERFYRVDKARSRNTTGSGLGLAIVKRIVELHDSEIHLESKLGSGTRFWFTLKRSLQCGVIAR